MSYYIEEAVIVESYEKEPHFKVETVVPEIIRNRNKRKGLFSLFFDSLNDLFGNIFEDSFFSDNTSDNSKENLQPKEEKPETAEIVSLDEQKIVEFKYLYYEII